MHNLIVALGLVLLAGFSGAFNSALSTLSRSRLEDLLRERGEDGGRFLRSILEGDFSERLCAVILQALGNGGFALFSAWVWVFPDLARAGRFTFTAGARVGLILLTLALVRVLSLLIGTLEKERLILAAGRPMWLLSRPVTPFARLLSGWRPVLERILGHAPEEAEERREEELVAAVSDGARDGVVAEEQREMIESIFDFKDSDVADIITPRTEMISIDVSEPVAEAVRVALESGFSRLPVHQETRDNIVGIYYVRDTLRYWGQENGQMPALRELLHKPIFVPESKRISELLREMQKGKAHMAIVLDEYGGTAGLVTIEDVLEEIVGEIQDEYDEAEAEQEIRKLDADTLIVQAHVHVSEVNEALDSDVIPEDDDYETVSGFVLSVLGHIPQPAETFEFGPLQVKVLAADERKVKLLQIHQLRETPRGQ